MTSEKLSNFAPTQVQQLTPECQAFVDKQGIELFILMLSTSSTCSSGGRNCKMNAKLDVTYSCTNTGPDDICEKGEARRFMADLRGKGQTSTNQDVCIPAQCANSNDIETMLGLVLTIRTQTPCHDGEKVLEAQAALGKAELSFVDKSDLSMSCALTGGGEIKGSKKGVDVEDPFPSHSSRREGSMPLAAIIVFFVLLSA